jgi:hypothetical protein
MIAAASAGSVAMGSAHGHQNTGAAGMVTALDGHERGAFGGKPPRL